MRISGVYKRSNIFVYTITVGPQTDGICAGFVASYADGHMVYVIGGTFINLQKTQTPRFVTKCAGCIFILNR
jgi:hypothetical protein